MVLLPASSASKLNRKDAENAKKKIEKEVRRQESEFRMQEAMPKMH
jgi:hypothetical protein